MQAVKKLQKKPKESHLYITRSRALRRLGIDIAEFRQICILKGVFPRVPKNAPKGRDRIYYHTKDIRFLTSEPMLYKLRQQRIVARRVVKAVTKNDRAHARNLKDGLDVELDLTHILKERYPSLVSALRDMDDALTLVALFAACPARNTDQLEGQALAECRTLIDQWMYLTAEMGVVQKCFASIKGYYYEAEILGQKIVWLMPHEFNMETPDDTVDYKVMANFLTLYRFLMRMVLFKLYRMNNMEYPPSLKHAGHTEGRFLGLVSKRTEGPTLVVSNEKDDDNDDSAPLQLVSQSEDAVKRRKLFANQVVFVSRETPQFHLLYLLKACGAKAFGFSDERFSALKATDPKVTHHIADVPVNALERYKSKVGDTGRSYVQPQWLLDSVNAGALLPMEPYALGVVCPPHVSPFGSDVNYTPQQQIVVEKWVSETHGSNSHAGETEASAGESAMTSAEVPATKEAPAKTAAPAKPAAPASDTETSDTPPLTDAEKQRAEMMLSKKKRALYKAVKKGEDKKTKERKRLESKAKKLSR